MNRVTHRVIQCIGQCIGGVILAFSVVTSHAQTVAISTLPPGAINNVQAQAIAKTVQENSDLQMRVITFNSPAAILGSVQNRQAELAVTSNDETGQALRGLGEHNGRAMTDLRFSGIHIPVSGRHTGAQRF